MSFSRAPVRLIIILFAIAVAGCVEDKDYGEVSNLRPNVNRNVDVNSNQNIADDSEEKLDSLVNLPFEPVENIFREDEVVTAGNSERSPGPADRRLTVVLRFSPDDTKALLDKVSKGKAPFETFIEPEPWFPAELKAKSETSGSQQLKGIGYGAQDFMKSPWSNGSLVRIDETDYFVLTLQTS